MIPAAKSFVLVAVAVDMDARGRYHVHSFYTIKKEQVDGRRRKGFLKVATKAKGPR